MSLPNVTVACGARTRDGDICSNPAMPNGRCRMHGGNHPSGIASPHYVHGLRAKPRNLPAHMAASYETARQDPELISLREEIASTDARIDELWEKAAQETPLQTYERMMDCWREAEKNRHLAESGDEKKKREFWDAYSSFGLMLAAAVDDQVIKREIRAEEAHRAQLSIAERGRLKDLGAMVTSEKAINLIAGVLGILRKHVLAQMEAKAARKLLMAVQTDVNRLLGRGAEVSEPSPEIVD
jgi:hypothetical protein